MLRGAAEVPVVLVLVAVADLIRPVAARRGGGDDAIVGDAHRRDLLVRGGVIDAVGDSARVDAGLAQHVLDLDGDGGGGDLVGRAGRRHDGDGRRVAIEETLGEELDVRLGRVGEPGGVGADGHVERGDLILQQDRMGHVVVVGDRPGLGGRVDRWRSAGGKAEGQPAGEHGRGQGRGPAATES